MSERKSSDRVFRGGCWFNSASAPRSSFRVWYDAGLRNDFLGFRVRRRLR